MTAAVNDAAVCPGRFDRAVEFDDARSEVRPGHVADRADHEEAIGLVNKGGEAIRFGHRIPCDLWGYQRRVEKSFAIDGFGLEVAKCAAPDW